MAINVIKQASPGIVVNELDLTGSSLTPGQPTVGAFVGEFAWGPVHQPTMVTSPGQFWTVFRDPNDLNEVSNEGSSFFTAYNFLGYGPAGLYVVREVGEEARNAYGAPSRDVVYSVNGVSSNTVLYSANTGNEYLYLESNPFTSNIASNFSSFSNQFSVYQVGGRNALIMTNDVTNGGTSNTYWNRVRTVAVKADSTYSNVYATSANNTHYIDRFQKPGDPWLRNENFQFDSANPTIPSQVPLDGANNFICFSSYFRVNGGISNVRMQIFDSQRTGDSFYADFRLSGSGSSTSNASFGSCRNYANGVSISQVSTGVYRCSVSTKMGATSNGYFIFRNTLFKNNTNVFQGTATDALAMGNLQAEERPKATSGPTSVNQNKLYSVSKDTYLGDVQAVTDDSATVTIQLVDPLSQDLVEDRSVKFMTRYYSSDLIIKNYQDLTTKLKGSSLKKHGPFAAKYPGKLGNSLKIAVCSDSSQFNSWIDPKTGEDYSQYFDQAPGTSQFIVDRNADKNFDDSFGYNDEIHILVIDDDGLFSGTPGTILEKFVGLSKGSDVIGPNGRNYFYKDYINQYSNYIAVIDLIDPDNTSLTWGKSYKLFTSFANADNFIEVLNGGIDQAPTANTLNSGWDLIKSSEDYNYDIVLTGGYSNLIRGEFGNTVIDSVYTNVVAPRKDCVMFISPMSGDVVDVINSDQTESNNILEFVGTLSKTIRSSYVVMDNNWKYQYDPWNKIYRWVPLNGDVAGLCARVDKAQDPWWSPAGYTRGKIMNVTKLAWNAKQNDRDILYKSGINPVIYQTGEGTILFGDKTFVSKQTAFDRINVRRLFLTLEKTIKRAARLQLFEFNDEFTRNRFVSIIEPFLREVQGRRGIDDFRVICDDSNNTPSVIDSNGFIADIYIKPARSINFIQLNFIATKTGVDFRTLFT